MARAAARVVGAAFVPLLRFRERYFPIFRPTMKEIVPLRMAAKIDCDHLCVSGGTAEANTPKYKQTTTIPTRKGTELQR